MINGLNACILKCDKVFNQTLIPNPYKVFTYYLDGNNRVVKSLSLWILINALHDIDKYTGNPIRIDYPDEDFSFYDEYIYCIRLTEITSGKWKDLDTIAIKPLNTIETTHKDSIRLTSEFILPIDCSVLLPPKVENEKFEIKVLVKCLRDSDELWKVQAISPIEFKAET